MLVGASGGEAVSSGENTISSAEVFGGLQGDFDDIVASAKSGCGSDIGDVVRGAYDDFGSTHADSLTAVEKHGSSAGVNLQADAYIAQNADSSSGMEFGGVDVPQQSQSGSSPEPSPSPGPAPSPPS